MRDGFILSIPLISQDGSSAKRVSIPSSFLEIPIMQEVIDWGFDLKVNRQFNEQSGLNESNFGLLVFE